ncbi:hypothetical protein [Streptomyces sp. sk2.1]|nr:hypothetical protein EAO76_24415 [Streptomyces sp. sk2.1]
MTGLSAVVVAAVVGALAPTAGVLIAALALQGAGAALVAPAALALVAAQFVDPRERGRAFGVYAAVAIGGWPAGRGDIRVRGLARLPVRQCPPHTDRPHRRGQPGA